MTELRAIGTAGYVSASVGQPTTVSFNIMFKASALGDCMIVCTAKTRFIRGLLQQPHYGTSGGCVRYLAALGGCVRCCTGMPTSATRVQVTL